MTKNELIGLVRIYERLIDAMQGHVFYVEDDEGVLRRWTPPAVVSFRRLSPDTTEQEGQ